jgi:phosphatidylinositol glycan class T
MPYNVITMTCTILALYFGSLFNLFTRRFEAIKVVPEAADGAGGRKKWWMFWKKK